MAAYDSDEVAHIDVYKRQLYTQMTDGIRIELPIGPFKDPRTQNGNCVPGSYAVSYTHLDVYKRQAYKIPRSVQDVIPIQRIFADGIFQFGTKYSRTLRFSDINYAIASKEDKTRCV